MKRSKAVLVSAVSAMVGSAVLLTLAWERATRPGSRGVEKTQALTPDTREPSLERASGAETVVATQPVQPQERFIEDQVAELGEDLGGAFYLSRIRETVREGNPSFGRELLRQMKEEHPQSGLIGEAEALLQEIKRKGR